MARRKTLEYDGSTLYPHSMRETLFADLVKNQFVKIETYKSGSPDLGGVCPAFMVFENDAGERRLVAASDIDPYGVEFVAGISASKYFRKFSGGWAYVLVDDQEKISLVLHRIAELDFDPYRACEYARSLQRVYRRLVGETMHNSFDVA